MLRDRTNLGHTQVCVGPSLHGFVFKWSSWLTFLFVLDSCWALPLLVFDFLGSGALSFLLSSCMRWVLSVIFSRARALCVMV